MNNAANSNQTERTQEPFVMADYISRPALADQLHVTARTLELWAHQRKGPRTVVIGRKAFYHVDDVEAWLESQRKAAMQNEPRQRRVS